MEQTKQSLTHTRVNFGPVHNRRRRVGAILLGLLVVPLVYAQHVDCSALTNGTGTLASPYNTLASVGALGTNATLYLKRGCRCEGQIDLVSNATGVSIQAYGTGDEPIVDGSTALTTWTNEGSGLWSAPWAGTARLMHLYVNDARQTMARYPNQGWLRNEQYSTGPARVRPATDTPLPSGNLIGSQIVFRSSNFTYDVRIVSALNGQGELELQSGFSTAAPSNRWGFFLQGNLDLLDEVGEWCHDLANNRVYLNTGDAVNTPSGVRVSNHSFGVRLPGGSTGNTSIDIRGIEFRYQSEAGVVFSGNGLTAHAVTIEDCVFRDLYMGIHDRTAVPAPGGMVISGNTFINCFDTAFLLVKDESIIAGNTLLDIGLHPGFGKSGYGGYIGMQVRASGCTVEGNVINRTGYGAIEANGSGTIRRNHISRASTILTDGGGIQFDLSDGLTIEENTVLDLGDPANLESAAPDYHAYSQLNFGIYFGNRSIQNTLVRANTVANCVKGIYVDHSLCSENAQVIDNTLFGNKSQLSITDLSNEIAYCGGTGNYPPGTGGPNYLSSYDDTYSGNILYGLSSGHACVEQSNRWAANLGALVDFGEFDGNYCFNPFTSVPNRIAVAYSRPEFSSYQTPVTFGMSNSDWVAQFDAAAEFSPLQLPDHAVSSVAQVMLTEQFNGGTVPAGWSCGLPGTRTNESNALRSIGSPWVEHLPGCGSEIDPVIGKYRLSFSASSVTPTVLSAGYWYNDQNLYLSQRFVEVGTSLDAYEMVVELDREAPGDYRWFNITDGKYGAGVNATCSLLVDNVTVERVTLNSAHADEVAANHRLFYHCPLPGTDGDARNVSATNGILTVPGESDQCWSDVHGNFYPGGQQIPIDEWASIVLFRMDPVFDIDVAGLNPPEYPISTNTTWNTPKNVRGSIVVESGATLTIDGTTIRFAESNSSTTTNIVVRPGGMLVLQNYALLTTLMKCGDTQMWDGIKVLGASHGYDWSPEQGRVEVLSGSRISNALTAILASDTDPAAPGFTGPAAGGAVRTYQAVFENNLHDVVMHKGGLLTGLSCLGGPCQSSAFRYTQFITTAPLNRAALHPKTHVRLSNRKTTWVHGCTFSNDLPEHTESEKMGHGLESFNTALRAVRCLNPSCHTPAPNTFANLDHGIRITEAFPKHPVAFVHGNAFADNICGVYVAGVNGVSLVGNEFTMGRWEVDMSSNLDEIYWDSHHRGIFTTASNALEIVDNQFERTPGNTTPLEGIVVGYTRDANEVVYRNAASSLDRAFVGEGISADVDNDPAIVGLQFQCNTNTNNAVNFLSRIANGDMVEPEKHTIRERQGTTEYSASNNFDGDMHFAVDTRADAIEYITYSHSLGDGPVTYTVQDLGDLDKDYLVPEEVGELIECGGRVWTDGAGDTRSELSSALAAARLDYGDQRAQYEQLIDGGSTEAVVDEIAGASPLEIPELRTSLLQKSPYLSVGALKELLQKAGVPDSIRAEVLLAIPDATRKKGFLRWAELEAAYPLPGYLAEAVEASWALRTYRTALEEGLADKHTGLSQLAYHALYRMQSDSLPAPPDSLLWVMRQVRTTGARFAEAAWLLGQERHAEADALLQAIPQEKGLTTREEQERQRMLALTGVLATAADESRDAYHLNASEVSELQELVGDAYDRPAVWASNLLCAVYGQCRAPFTGDGGEAKSRRSRSQVAVSTVIGAGLSIQPNPARDAVNFDLGIGANQSDIGELVIRDMTGRVLLRRSVAQGINRLVISAEALSPGMYTAELRFAARVVDTEQFIVQP